jgi:methyl-accepting chemotaxis protein
MATMIERAMAEQGRGIKQVSEAITNVKQKTAQITGATQAQTKGTERILGSAEGMRDIARRVRISMDEQGRGGRQIAAAAENVTVRAGAIANGTREQQQVIRQTLGVLERIQNLPRQNIKKVEEMAESLKVLEEQGKLLNQEIAGAIVGERKQGKG